MRPCRIFRLQGVDKLEATASKLDKAVSEDEQIVPGTHESVRLRVNVEKMLVHEGERFATGILIYDEPILIKRRDGSRLVEVQSLATGFGLVGGSVCLVIFSSQMYSQYVRARMGPILAQLATRATAVRIGADRMNDFLHHHPHTLRTCSWMGLTIPRIAKARISGFDITQTPDYARYEQHGEKNSLMLALHTLGWTITLNSQGAVTIWNDVEEITALRFIRDEVLPLCAPSSQPTASAVPFA